MGQLLKNLLETGFHSFEWDERKREIQDYRRVWADVDKQFFKKNPAVLRVCYFFRLPVDENTEVMEGIVTNDMWKDTWDEWQYVILGSDGEEYYDTETCIMGKNKKEVERIMNEWKESLD